MAMAAIGAASAGLMSAIVGGVGSIMPEASDAFLFAAAGVAPAAVGIALLGVVRVGGLVSSRATVILMVAATVAGLSGGLAAWAVRVSFDLSDDGRPTAAVDLVAMVSAACGVLVLAAILATLGAVLLRRARLPGWAATTVGVTAALIAAPVVGVVAAVVPPVTAVASLALIGCAVEMRRRMPVAPAHA
ncbi:hypothetical protein [Microbacterium sp. MM2322]|uniref:hypothetical protein n=1 Tax=Microbacterium sp. MM2322 TaxID=3157631 RepID=UPI0032D5A242